MRAGFGRLSSAHFGWAVALLACGGAGLVAAYWALLTDAGAKISLLALLAVLLASKAGSTPMLKERPFDRTSCMLSVETNLPI